MQREGYASGSAAGLASRPAVALTSSSGGPPGAETASRAPTWDELFRALPTGRQRDLLALASRQGLLYEHQLPPANGTPPQHPRSLLTRLLAGRVEDLESTNVPPVELTDKALDATQREAVARALHTQDIFLLQGGVGTGKSRVVAEIVIQAIARGERVLLIAPCSPPLDHVLELVGANEAIYALRCLERGEAPEVLPRAVQPLTFVAQARALSEESARASQALFQAEHRRVERLRKTASAWDCFAELARRRHELGDQREALRQRRADLPTAVEQAALALTEASPPTAFAREVRASARVYHEAQARLDARAAELAQARAACEQARAELEQECATLQPLAEARQGGQVWHPRWWRAVYKGVTPERWQDCTARLEAAEQTRADLDAQETALAAERAEAERTRQATQAQACAAECARRQAELDDQDAAWHQEDALLAAKWQALCRDLGPDTPAPAALTPAAVAEARATAERVLADALGREAFARRWADHLAQTPQDLAQRLPGLVNLVAATPAALAHDPHFGPAASAAGFDLLIVEQADQVTEAEFLALARRAPRWVLVGAPDEPVQGKPGTMAETPGGPSSRRRESKLPQAALFHRLWQALHFDPSRLPYAWMEENGRLVCQLRPVRAEQRGLLELEHVADFPDIQLRILLESGRPTLAEVAFPATMTIGDAKKYIYHELQELPLRVSSRSLCWVEEPHRLVLRLADDAAVADPICVTLEDGVRELVRPAAPNGAVTQAPWFTCCVEFDRAAGWHRRRAEDWLARHANVRDLGRTAFLNVHYRLHPELVRFAADLGLLALPNLPAAAPAPPLDGSPTRIEWVPVPTLARDRGARGRDRGRVVDTSTLLAQMKGGAGLEVFLDDPRQAERLPAEARAVLPARGLVNYPEAQAVVRTLTGLARDQALVASLAAAQAPPAVTVLALYPAQAALLRHLIEHTPALATAPFRLQVDVPAAYQQRDGLVVLLSLTRSHTHRAVAFGDDPDALPVALTRARAKLILFGDPGTLVRRTHYEGPVDHLDAVAAARERSLIAQLLRHLQGQGSQPHLFRLREGDSA